MASRFGLTLPSLTRLICPDLCPAIALRPVSRYLRYAETCGFLFDTYDRFDQHPFKTCSESATFDFEVVERTIQSSMTSSTALG